MPALASRSPDAISRWRSGTTLGCRLPSRSRSAGGTVGQPPRATIASYRAIACSVCCTVAGDSVGSEAFGIRMVREAESKPWPNSLALVLLDQRLQRASCGGARTRPSVAGQGRRRRRSRPATARRSLGRDGPPMQPSSAQCVCRPSATES